jgi:hypothetical protein
MTRDEAEEAAREDAENGEGREVPAYAEAWYEAERVETFTRLQRRRHSDLRRRGVVIPWWETC